MSKVETYPVTPANIGNSRGFRIDAALFREHPEMREGSFEAAYLGAGTLLVRPRVAASSTARRRADELDLVAAAYLAWTERTMIEQPELLRAMTQREFEIAEALVAGVSVDLERDSLPEEFELP